MSAETMPGIVRRCAWCPTMVRPSTALRHVDAAPPWRSTGTDYPADPGWFLCSDCADEVVACA